MDWTSRLSINGLQDQGRGIKDMAERSRKRQWRKKEE
jgi:hypothetical protein